MSQQLCRYSRYQYCRILARQHEVVFQQWDSVPATSQIHPAVGPRQQRPFSCAVSSFPEQRLSTTDSLSTSYLDGAHNNHLHSHNNKPPICQPAWMGSTLRASRLVDPNISFTTPGKSGVRWFSSDDDEDSGLKKSKQDKQNKPKEEATNEPTKEETGDTVSSAAGDADSKTAEPEPPTKDAEEKKGGEEDEDDECPSWMNPLHFKDPDNEKIFAEDFGPGEEMPILEAPPLEDPNNPDKILASQELYDLADEIVHLSMLEMKELINKIGDHFGFEKPPFTGSDGSGGGGGDDDEEGEDGGAEAAATAKTVFDLKLVSFDAKSKIKVIKEVRAIAGLGLKEAKEMVEGVPKVVMKDISKEQAEELQKKLEEVGATVEIV